VCVVGDDPIVEMRMARRAGAAAVGVTTGMMDLEGWARQPDHQRPDRVITDLRQLLPLL
jgi:NagD protein